MFFRWNSLIGSPTVACFPHAFLITHMASCGDTGPSSFREIVGERLTLVQWYGSSISIWGWKDSNDAKYIKILYFIMEKTLDSVAPNQSMWIASKRV